MNVLLTGFGPFHHFSINPTTLLVEAFPELPEINLKKVVFDVNFEQLELQYPTILADFAPDLIINLGLSATAQTIELEEFALNTAVPHQVLIMEKGPAAYRTALPLNELKEELNKAGIPTKISHHAGTFLCNFIYYHSLSYMQSQGGKALFVHLPFSTELVAQFLLQGEGGYPSLPMQLLQNAIELIIKKVKNVNV